MASEDINDAVELGDNQNAKTKRIANFDSGVADLEKVTDYVEEAEILSKNLCDAMKVLNDQQKLDARAKQEKEHELSKVKINREDVDLIVQEMDIPRTRAERILREYKGCVVDALTELIR